MEPGGYSLSVNFAPVDPSAGVGSGTAVTLRLQGQGAPGIASVVSAASLQPSISAGEIVSIFGTHLSTPPLNGQLSDAGVYPTTLGNTQVTFNGIAAPLLYVSNNQINCLVPYGVAGHKTVDVVVARVFKDFQYGPLGFRCAPR